MTTGVAYDPNNPTQNSFLAALALGETGNNPNAYQEGVGNVDLSGDPTNQYGFPIWGGTGNSHAAGAFQFQPATWAQYASADNLNFQNPLDQNQAAWDLAQDTYAQKTNGGSLMDALTSGNISSVQSALKGVWPSVTGNAAAPQGLTGSLASGSGSSLIQTAANSVLSMVTGGALGSTSGSTDWVGTIEQFFVRFGLIIIGSLIVIVALWQLLSSKTGVPSPGDTVKAVGRTAGEAVALA